MVRYYSGADAGAPLARMTRLRRPLLRAARSRARIPSSPHAGLRGRRFGCRWRVEQLRILFLQVAEFRLGQHSQAENLN
jgi:hypothetical protein